MVVLTWASFVAVLIPNFAGFLSSIPMVGQLYNDAGDAFFQKIKKPSWVPPSSSFAFILIFLYSAMGYSSYLVYEACGGFTEKAVVPLSMYILQLCVNATYTYTMFTWHLLGWAFLHACTLDVLVLLMTYYFWPYSQASIYFLIPYYAWLTFATFMIFTVWRLNKDHPPAYEKLIQTKECV